MENIKTIALRYITFSKDLQLVYFEFLGKRYNIKCTKDIYHELVKFLVKKYSDLITYQDNKLILQRNSFKLELYKKENLPTYTKTRHIFSDWYLITHFPIAQLEKKIREIVSAFDFDDEKIIIGYYPKKQEEQKQQKEQERQKGQKQQKEQEQQKGQEGEMGDTIIKTTTLKDITFSDDLQLEYIEVYEQGEVFGLRFEVQNIKDVYQTLVKLFVEKYPNCLSLYKDEEEIFLKANFILDLFKREEYLDDPEILRPIVDDLYLYVSYPISMIEEKIKNVVSVMSLLEDDVIIGYYSKVEEEARLKAEEEAKKLEEEIRRAEEEARQAEEEAKRVEEELRKIEEEERKRAEEEARKRAEEEARKRAEEEARKRAEEEAKKLEEEIRRAEEEARQAEEEAKRVEEELRKIEEEKEINFPSEIENTDSSIQTTTLKDITFSDDLNFAYFELWGNFYGKHFEIKNIKDFYCKLVFIFIEKYPDCLTYSKNQLSLEKDNFILRLYKEKYFSSFALKFGYIRNIFEDWFLYINFPLCELEHKIKKIVSAMELTDQEVVLGYYPNEPVEEETEESVEEETEEPAEEETEEPAEEQVEEPAEEQIEEQVEEQIEEATEEPAEESVEELEEESVEELEEESVEELEEEPEEELEEEAEELEEEPDSSPTEIENTDSNIQKTTLRDITFSVELELAYFELRDKKYEIKRAKDIYHELVKIFVKKFAMVYNANQLVFEGKNFTLKLYKKNDIISSDPRHIFDDWYLRTHYSNRELQQKIRKLLSALNIPEEQVIIGYYPNNAVSFPTAEVKENQVNYTPVKIKPEQPKEDMLLFSSDLKKVKNKFFDYLINVKNFEEVKAKNYVLAFSFYCYSNNISFSLNNVAYFEEQIANDELLSSHEIIANRTREVFPVFLDFVQYYQEQKEKELDTIKTNCVSILKEKFANGYRVSESAKIDYKKFCNFYKNKFDKELELEKEELNDFLKSFTFLYSDTVYLPEFVISEETKNNLFDFIKKCFSEHKFVYYDTIYNKFSLEFNNGMINTCEILKKYLLEINGEEINFKDNGDYISVPNEEIDSDYILKHFENWLFEAGRVVKMDEIENNFFNLISDKSKFNRIKDLIKSSRYIVENSSSKENGSDYFHIDIINLANQEFDKIGELVKNKIQYGNGKFIVDDDFIKILRENEEFSDKYDFISDLGLKRYFKIKLDKVLRFRNQKVEMRDSYVSYEDIVEDFIEQHNNKFNNDDVKILMKDLNYSFDKIYNLLSESAIRISENEYVTNENVDFLENKEKIDNLIGEFCGNKKYVFVKDVTVFSGFPNVGYAWNKFLLESYVNRYSRKYKLVNTVFFEKNVFGVIVEKFSNLTLEDCLADVLRDASVTSSEEEAIKYFVENGYLYKKQNISEVMAKAR